MMKEQIQKLRDDFYNQLPTRAFGASELLEVIKKHFGELDNLIESATVTDEDIAKKAVDYDNDCFESGYQDLTIQDHFMAGATAMREGLITPNKVNDDLKHQIK